MSGWVAAYSRHLCDARANQHERQIMLIKSSALTQVLHYRQRLKVQLIIKLRRLGGEQCVWKDT